MHAASQIVFAKPGTVSPATARRAVALASPNWPQDALGRVRDAITTADRVEANLAHHRSNSVTAVFRERIAAHLEAVASGAKDTGEMLEVRQDALAAELGALREAAEIKLADIKRRITKDAQALCAAAGAAVSEYRARLEENEIEACAALAIEFEPSPELTAILRVEKSLLERAKFAPSFGDAPVRGWLSRFMTEFARPGA